MNLPNHAQVTKINELILTKYVRLDDLHREEEQLVTDINNLRHQMSGVQLGQKVEAEAQVLRNSQAQSAKVITKE